MTPELEKEIIVGALSAFFGALFTGVPALLLFWWTWQRDQERLVVQKLLSFGETAGGKRVQLRDQNGPLLGILIRNRSLFPVRISAAGFQVDGEVLQLENLQIPLPMKRNPDASSSYPYIVDDDKDRWEIGSQRQMRIEVTGPADRKRLSEALGIAAERQGIPVGRLLLGNKVAALVALESGRIFSSLPLRTRIWRRIFVFQRARGRSAGNGSSGQNA